MYVCNHFPRCEVPTVSRRHVVMGRLSRPANLGVMSEDVQIVVVVVAPVREVSDLEHLAEDHIKLKNMIRKFP